MSSGNFSFPTSVSYGAGCLKDLSGVLDALDIRNPLLVTDPGLLATPVVEAVKKAAGRPCTVFSEVHGNPIEADVEAGTEAYRMSGADGVLGVGGGSALDVAKIIRARVAKPEVKLADFYTVKEWPKLAPFVAIPTTAGTGSEVGRSSVIGLGGKKQVFFHPSLLAAKVLLDPELTVGLPPALTAATGMDAFTHCVESFASPVFHPFCDGIALEGARMIVENLPKAVKNGKDLEARGQMQVAAAMGGIAFQKDLGAVHSMAHPLSAMFGMHHGLTNALCLIAVMEFNARKKPGLYARLGQALGLKDTADGAVIDRVRKLLAECGIQGGLAAHKVAEKDVAKLAAAATEDSCHATNPVKVTTQDFEELYRRCL